MKNLTKAAFFFICLVSTLSAGDLVSTTPQADLIEKAQSAANAGNIDEARDYAEAALNAGAAKEDFAPSFWHHVACAFGEDKWNCKT